MKEYVSAKNFIKSLVLIFGLNFIWEISQMSLYNDHSNGFIDFILVHVRASLGDVILFAIIYLASASIFQDFYWFMRKQKYIYVFTLICGFALATVIEKYALATNRWSYNDLMPIIPFFKVGLSPILQLTILPAITILITQKIYPKK